MASPSGYKRLLYAKAPTLHWLAASLPAPLFSKLREAVSERE
jgi:hypothetical protein